jgi:hypothetical protein
MSFFRKSPRSDASAPAKRADPADQLRADISALDGEIADSQRALADFEKRTLAAEARAMEAIRIGDDHAARACLVEQQSHAEKAAGINADLKVLRAILTECNDFQLRLGDVSDRGRE